MSGWKTIVLFLAMGYVALAVVMYVAQRALMYFPDRIRTAPPDAGLPQAEEIFLDMPDGERIIVWHIAPHPGHVVVLYFHGNGGSLRYRVDRFKALTAAGEGLVALSYRGYGGSTGHPTETGLITDAAAAYAFATARYSTDKIVVWGESLGSGIAIAIAAEKPIARLILEAPFSSAVDIAAHAYPFLPVRWLMKDQFRSDLRIAKVRSPVLIFHGDRDGVVPIASGERLYHMVEAPKRFVRVRGGEHETLGAFGIVEAARQFMYEKFD
jgi:uncharacterized protein